MPCVQLNKGLVGEKARQHIRKGKNKYIKFETFDKTNFSYI